jgi:hypothetical protein
MLLIDNGQPRHTGFLYVANVPPAAVGQQWGQTDTRGKLADMIRPVLPGLLLLAAVAAAVFYSDRRPSRR